MDAEVLNFWFEELKPSQWWKKDTEIDELIRKRFFQIHTHAACCELFTWRKTSQGRLAEIIVLDQFSRNMFRGDRRSFAHDNLALALAQEAVSLGADKELPTDQKCFLYMPYMHSESLLIHEIAMHLFSTPGLEANLKWEIKHKKIIERFGRYPHRNEMLGRESTEEEIAFLKQPGSSF